MVEFLPEKGEIIMSINPVPGPSEAPIAQPDILVDRKVGDACWIACQGGDRKEVERLIREELGGDVNRRFECSYDNDTCRNRPICLLEAAALWGKTDLVVWLIDKKGALVDDEASFLPPLHRACRYGNIDVAEALLARRANPERLNEFSVEGSGLTPLQFAAMSHRGSECVLALQRHGVVLNGPEGARKSPLQLALMSGNWETALTFIESGVVNLNFQGANGLTVFDDAWEQKDNVEIATELLMKGVRVKPYWMVRPYLLSRQGLSPTNEMMRLMIVQNGQIPHNLFRYDHDPDQRGDYDARQQVLAHYISEALPDLHYACYTGNLWAVQKLLEHDEGDNSCGSPLEIAAANGHRDVVAFLLDEEHPPEGLIGAIQGGHLGVVEEFAERGLIPKDDPNLFLIAAHGRFSNMEIALLLERKGVALDIDRLAGLYIRGRYAYLAPLVEAAMLHRLIVPNVEIRQRFPSERKQHLQALIDQVITGEWCAFMEVLAS